MYLLLVVCSFSQLYFLPMSQSVTIYLPILHLVDMYVIPFYSLLGVIENNDVLDSLIYGIISLGYTLENIAYGFWVKNK